MTATRLDPRTAPPAARPALPLVLAAAAAPVLFTAGSVLFPALPVDAAGAVAEMARRPEVVLAGRLLTGVGALLFVCTAVVLAALAPARARAAGALRAGLGLVAVGTAGNGISQVVQAYGTDAALDAVHEAALPLAGATAVVERVADGAVGLPLGYWTLVAFGLGWLVVAAALLRSGLVGRARPVLLVAAVVLGFALASPGWPSLALVPFALVVLDLVRVAAAGVLPAPAR